MKGFSVGFFNPSRFLQENPFISFAKDIFSACAKYTGEQLQRKFSEIRRRGTLCFQVAFSLPAQRAICFKWYILKSGPLLFSSAAHFTKQPEIKAVQGFHPKTPKKR